MTHQFKAGDRALVLPVYTNVHYFNVTDIIEYVRPFGIGLHSFNGINRYYGYNTLQHLFAEQVIKLAPHHIGLPDYLDAE